jgi:protein O-GlcNAc transferase
MIRWLFKSLGRASAASAQDAAAQVETGLMHHRAGRLAEAEASYRKALADDPENIDALHFRGVVAYQRGEHSKAVELISRALSRNRANPSAHNNLGNALAAQGNHVAALTAYLDALAHQPDYADALCNLGDVLRSGGKVERAIGCYRRAVSIAPDLRVAQVNLRKTLEERSTRSGSPASGAIAAAEGAKADAELNFNLGNDYKDQKQLDQAIASYEKAVATAPDFPAAHTNLGSALLQLGKRHEATLCFRRALALEPELPEAHYNLGVASLQAGDLASAKSALRKYLESQPGDRAALLKLGEACSRSNELDEAADCLKQVLATDPLDAEAHNLLANVRRNQARHREALEHYELAILHGENPVVAFQNLLFCMLCTGTFSAEAIHARHREFARRFEEPLVPLRLPHANAPEPERRLRIGYVSPDFRSNIVAHYMQPILERHDRERFQVHCYFTGSAADVETGRISSLADQWHDASLLHDDAFAALIRAHQIDVLVDLCGHGPGNRILMFARKPAPVQVSYLDYSATTGLSSIDYRLSTEYCDPTGIADRYYSEKLYRLADTYWTYNPAARLPVSALPMQLSGYPTFGSFNLYYRITDEVVDLWSRLLSSVPHARLAIVGVAAGSTQAALLDRLDRSGIAPHRISMHGVVSYQAYNELITTVDVALAPFPYNGATTMMDCLWNGVPVVAKEGGETFCSRLGCSVLMQLGLSELIGRSDDEYIRIAVELASNVERLSGLRASLRPKMDRSPMRDFDGFTRGLEEAYRAMWRHWSAHQ